MHQHRCREILKTTLGKGFMHPVSINILKNPDLGAYMRSYTGLALVPLQSFTNSRRQESPANPPGLNTTFHNKCEHTAMLMDILQKGEKQEKIDLLSTGNYCLNPGEGQWKEIPARVLSHKILNQCKEQSTPFFQIAAKFHFLLISHCLVPFPAAWVSLTDLSPRGGRDTIAPCYTWGWRHGERKDQAHLLRFPHPKVHHPSLN